MWQKKELGQCGLELRPDKCGVYGRLELVRGEDFAPGGIFADVRRTSEGLMVVGSPIGTPTFVLEGLRQKGLRPAQELYAKLIQLPTAQDGLTLLRSSGITKYSYYARVTPPAEAAEVGAEFDQATAETFGALTEISLEELFEVRPGLGKGSSAWSQAQLPARLMGVGMQCQEALAPLAYLSSLAQCLGPLARAFPELQPHLNALRRADAEEDQLLPPLQQANQALRNIKDSRLAATLGKDVLFTWDQVLDRARGWPRVQRRLSRAWDIKKALEINNLDGDEPWHRSRTRSSGGSGNLLGMWITASPEGSTSKLPDAMVYFAVRWRLGLRIPTGMLAEPTVCGQTRPDPYGRHAGSCNWGGGRQAHHNYLAACLRLILTEAGATPHAGEIKLSEKGVLPDGRVHSGSRLDVGAEGLPHMQLELYDVRVSDPTQKRFVGSQAGACAKGSESEKIRKYGQACRRAGHVFYPFVMELYGRMGEQARKVLRQLAHFRATHLTQDAKTAKRLTSKLTTRWLQMLSATFVRGMWVRVQLHAAAKPAPKPMGISAAGAWTARAVWETGTKTPPTIDRWAVPTFPDLTHRPPSPASSSEAEQSSDSHGESPSRRPNNEGSPSQRPSGTTRANLANNLAEKAADLQAQAEEVQRSRGERGTHALGEVVRRTRDLVHNLTQTPPGNQHDEAGNPNKGDHSQEHPAQTPSARNQDTRPHKRRLSAGDSLAGNSQAEGHRGLRTQGHRTQEHTQHLARPQEDRRERERPLRDTLSPMSRLPLPNPPPSAKAPRHTPPTHATRTGTPPAADAGAAPKTPPADAQPSVFADQAPLPRGAPPGLSAAHLPPDAWRPALTELTESLAKDHHVEIGYSFYKARQGRGFVTAPNPLSDFPAVLRLIRTAMGALRPTAPLAPERINILARQYKAGSQLGRHTDLAGYFDRLVFGCVLENNYPGLCGLVFHAPQRGAPPYRLPEAPGLAFLQEEEARYKWAHEVPRLPTPPPGEPGPFRLSITWRWFRPDWIAAGGPKDGLPPRWTDPEEATGAQPPGAPQPKWLPRPKPPPGPPPTNIRQSQYPDTQEKRNPGGQQARRPNGRRRRGGKPRTAT